VAVQEGKAMNPIYVEHCSSEHCDCYKIDLPWTKYRKESGVLCPVAKGYSLARLIATGVIVKHFAEATAKESK